MYFLFLAEVEWMYKAQDLAPTFVEVNVSVPVDNIRLDEEVKRVFHSHSSRG